jgi:predicted nucleic acid-binding protein
LQPIVVDASTLAEYLLRTTSGTRAEAVVQDPEVELHAPSLCDVEISSVLRRALLTGRLSEGRARQALEDYLDLPLVRHGHRYLLARVLTLRDNFSAYDATYVALAERLGAGLLTADTALGRAARSHTSLQVLSV